MKNRLRTFLPALAFVLLLTSHPHFSQTGQGEANQVSQQMSRGHLIYALGGKKCLPAEVTGIGQGGAPPEGLEVVIKNFDRKTIQAVKLGWYFVEDKDMTLPGRFLRTPCEAPPLPDKIILSGNTQLIEVGPLDSQQTCAIGKQPLKFKYNDVDKIALTDFHLMTIDDIKELTTDGTIRTLKGIYSVVLAVTEIHYADGSTWKLEGAPPPLALN
jgi:hypothetical protein